MRRHEGRWWPFPVSLPGHGGSPVPPSAVPASFPLPAPIPRGNGRRQNTSDNWQNPPPRLGPGQLCWGEVAMGPGCRQLRLRWECQGCKRGWGDSVVWPGAPWKYSAAMPWRNGFINTLSGQGLWNLGNHKEKIGTETAGEAQHPRKHLTFLHGWLIQSKSTPESCAGPAHKGKSMGFNSKETKFWF